MNYLLMQVYTDHEHIDVADFLYVPLTRSTQNYLKFRLNSFSKIVLPDDVKSITCEPDPTIAYAVDNYDLWSALTDYEAPDWLVVDYMPDTKTIQATIRIEFDVHGNFCFTGWNKNNIVFHTHSISLQEIEKSGIFSPNRKEADAQARL